jgi:hypothetical protein
MLPGDRDPVVTRRTLLTAATAATMTAPLVMGDAAAAAAAVPRVRVTPVWTEELRRTYGVGVLSAASAPVYTYVDDWMQRLADLGAPYVRGRYQPRSAKTAQIVERCRALGLTWLMSVVPENWSMSEQELRATLEHIRDNAADVCIGIENMNEPNHNRDGTPVRPDWPQLTVGYQRVIKTFLDSTPSMDKAVSVGPSLQMGADDPTPDFFALRDAGLPQYLDYAGLHSYPSGWGPAAYVDLRLGWVRDAWGAIPTWVTETGYNTAHNAPFNGDEGPKPVPQDVAATYGPRSVLEYARRGCRAVRFQLLDQPNAADDEPSYNRGLIENTGDLPSTWTPKPEYTTMQTFLASLRDSAASYTPPPFEIGVQGPKNLRWLPVGKSDGSRSLLMYRGAPVWDPDTRTRRTVKVADVTVTDRLGTRVVKVGADVVTLGIR